jgi:lipid II:glycine glycyltransferase (peptidoglycan interpeptide bridge formation enzyme)
MMLRKNFDTTVSVDEFQRVQERLSPEQKMVVLIARRKGLAVSGLVASTIGATGIYLLGATGDEGMKAKGSYLLQWHVLRRLKERGCDWYDLGGVDPEANPGVYHFKQGLGGDEVLHIGSYDLHRNRLNKWGLGAAERLKRLAGELTTSVKR